jgi:hypothetical protein
MVENLLIGEKLSEDHAGHRAFSRCVLWTLPLNENDDDFASRSRFWASPADRRRDGSRLLD